MGCDMSMSAQVKRSGQGDSGERIAKAQIMAAWAFWEFYPFIRLFKTYWFFRLRIVNSNKADNGAVGVALSKSTWQPLQKSLP